jgi:hypothetical protein
MRRTRNSAMAQSEFAGNQRAFRPMRQGIGAGSAWMRHQGGIASDMERAKGYAQAQQAIADNASMLANANLTYQTNAAGEKAGIRDLLLKNKQIDQSAFLDLRENDFSKEVSDYQRLAQNEAARLKRAATVGGILSGLFRS